MRAVVETATPGLSTQPEAPRPPSMTALGWARWGWRQLTSMRTALILLLFLAVAAVPGSLLPQRGVDPGAVAAYLAEHPTAGPLLDRLGFFEVFKSVWFSAIYLLLFVSLAGCVIPRSKAHWSAMRARPPAAPRNLDRLPVSRRFETDAAPAEVLAVARAKLRRARFRVDVEGDAVSAEKGFLRETGNLVFHLALLLLLVAVAAGHLFGYAGNVLVPVGSGFSNTVPAYDRFGGGAAFDPESLPPFSLTLDELTVRYQEGGQQSGAPRGFDAPGTYQPRPRIAAAHGQRQGQRAAADRRHEGLPDRQRLRAVVHGARRQGQRRVSRARRVPPARRQHDLDGCRQGPGRPAGTARFPGVFPADGRARSGARTHLGRSRIHGSRAFSSPSGRATSAWMTVWRSRCTGSTPPG